MVGEQVSLILRDAYVTTNWRDESNVDFFATAGDGHRPNERMPTPKRPTSSRINERNGSQSPQIMAPCYHGQMKEKKEK